MKSVKLSKAAIKKIGLYLLVSVLILTAVFIIYIYRKGNPYPDYTSFSAEPSGVKALYLLTGQMGYRSIIYEQSSRFLPDNATLVAIKPEMDIFESGKESSYLHEWISKGNSMILIDELENLPLYGLDAAAGRGSALFGEKNEDRIYTIGRGSVIYLTKPEKYTNQGLKSYTAGLEFINLLDRMENKNVLFSEYYHGYGYKALTPWDLLGPVGQLAVIQLLLGLLLLLAARATRLGKPVEVLEIIKRQENENLYALSNLYIRTKSNGVVLDTILREFKHELIRFLGQDGISEDHELIRAASENKWLSRWNLVELLSECNDYIETGSKDTGRLAKLAGKLDKIRKGLR